VAMEALSKGLRTTVKPAQLLDTSCSTCSTDAAFISADKTTVTFYGNVNNDDGIGPSRVRYRLVDEAVRPYSRVEETIWRPTAGANNTYSFCVINTTSCPGRTRVLARGLPLSTTSPQIFTYFNNAGGVITGLPLTGTDPKLGQVDSIDITLVVRTSTGYKTPATTLVDRVALPNADGYVPPDTTATPTP